jgi:hypothetical protein
MVVMAMVVAVMVVVVGEPPRMMMLYPGAIVIHPPVAVTPHVMRVVVAIDRRARLPVGIRRWRGITVAWPVIAPPASVKARLKQHSSGRWKQHQQEF